MGEEAVISTVMVHVYTDGLYCLPDKGLLNCELLAISAASADISLDVYCGPSSPKPSLKWAKQRRHFLHLSPILFGKEAALLLLILRAPDTSKSSPLRGSSPSLHSTSNYSSEKREKGLFNVYFYTNFPSRSESLFSFCKKHRQKFCTRTPHGK
jgi:hypothetical protein